MHLKALDELNSSAPVPLRDMTARNRPEEYEVSMWKNLIVACPQISCVPSLRTLEKRPRTHRAYPPQKTNKNHAFQTQNNVGANVQKQRR